ncbi:MAG: HIT domain-containing protein [Candidatus Vogelbacteria bacterium]|nr:HIT domain-containing protein [Candidatus Vogelbacteria bacterium]
MPKDCPFCVENGKVVTLCQNDMAYLVAACDGGGNVIDDRFLIIPKEHVESIIDLPSDWHGATQQLLSDHFGQTIAGRSFNLSFNQGQEAGQRVGHVHCWLIFRDKHSEGAASELGLSSLIDKMRKLS